MACYCALGHSRAMVATHLRLGAMVLLVATFGCRHHGPDWGVGGKVLTGDGAPVPGIQVRIHWPELGGDWLTVTDADGSYYHDWESDIFLSNEAQEHVVVTPESSLFTFAPSSVELRLPGVLTGIDFVATPTTDDLQVGWLLVWLPVGPEVMRPVIVLPDRR